jgi:hypothetical protein
MGNVPYGLICKNPHCKATIVVGDTWVAERQLAGGAKIVFAKMVFVDHWCASCRQLNRYAQADLQIFPGFSVASPATTRVESRHLSH